MHGNIIFNYISRVFTALAGFIFVPFYIKLLGPEGYSIIAYSLIVVSILVVLDFGLSSAIAREMARGDITDSDRYRAFCVIEKIYLGLFALVAAIGLVMSEFIARIVIGQTPIDRNLIAQCLIFISIEAGLQLIMRFYISVLTGLERQVQGSIFSIFWTLLRNGAVVAIILMYPDLRVFFLWQLIATMITVVALKIHSYEYTHLWPEMHGGVFDLEVLRRLRGFAVGMLLISLVAVANTQLDRLMIGSILSLHELAAYTLSASLGTAMLIAATPIMAAVQPRLTSHFTKGEYRKAHKLFYKASRLVALLVFPPAAIVSIYPEIVVLAWTGEQQFATIAGTVAPYLVMANVSIALATIAYATALANGFTRFNNVIGFASLLLSIPGYALAIRYSGVTGVALSYLAIQLASTLSFSWLIMKKFFGGGFFRHHLVNYAIPGLAAFTVALSLSAAIHLPNGTRLVMLGLLIAGVLVTGIASTGLSLVLWKIIDARSLLHSSNPKGPH